MSVSVFGQSKTNVAVFLGKVSTNNYQKEIRETIAKNLQKSSRVNYLFYGYDDDNSSKVVSFDALKSGDKKEAPAEYLLFVNNQVIYNTSPTIKFNVDTLNNIKRAYYELNYESAIHYKIVDFRTSEILTLNTLKSNQFGKGINQNIVEVKDFRTYFGSNLNKLKGKKRLEAEKAALRAYQSTINGRYSKAQEKAVKNVGRLDGVAAGLIDTKIYSISGPKPEEVEKKMTDFTAAFGSADNIKKGDNFSVFQVLEFEQGNVTDFVATSYVKELGETSSKMRTFPFQRKGLAEAYKSGNKMLMVRNHAVVEDKNTISDVKYRMSVEKGCVMCDFKLETNLNRITNIILIERGHVHIMKYLSERYKSEQFMDFDMEEFQSKQQGVEVLITRVNNKIALTEVGTGKMIDTGTKTYGSSLTTTLLEYSEKGIELLKIQKEKKNKIVEVLLYHPFSFFQGSKIDIVEVQVENFKGKSMERNVKIGDGTITRLISPNVAIMRVSDGKKELFAALQKGSNIRYTPFINDKKGGGLLNRLENIGSGN